MGADFLFAITEYIPNDSPEREALYKKINSITDLDFPFDLPIVKLSTFPLDWEN